MKKIIILWASVRPAMVYSTWQDWLFKCDNKERIDIKIAVATDEQKQKIESYNFNNCEVSIVIEKSGYPYAITKLTQELETDDDNILLLLSDDFFAPNHWDTYLYSQFDNYDGAVFLNDGYQSTAKIGTFCITLACLTFRCLKKLNKIVFHPAYNHFFCDTEAWQNFKALGILKDNRDIDNTVFEHRHYVRGGRLHDEHDAKNMNNWDIDHATYQNRMKLTVNERLGIKNE